MPNIKDVFNLDMLKTLVRESHKPPEVLKDPQMVEEAKRLRKLTDKYEEKLVTIYFEMLQDAIDLVDKRREEGDPEIIQEGTKNVLHLYANNLADYATFTAKTVFREGFKIYIGECSSCDSKTCPIIRITKPEQYDEEARKKVLKEPSPKRPRIKGFMIGGGDIPSPIRDLLKHIASDFSGLDLDDPGLKELADKLGISEDELKEHIKKGDKK